MRGNRQMRGIRASSLLAAVSIALVSLAPAPMAWATTFEEVLAAIDEALETNPYGVSEDSLRSCKAMRDTAVLLAEMGRYTRAVRRLNACTKLLGMKDFQSRSDPHDDHETDPGRPWFG